MTEEKRCSRCGACCMVLPLFTQHMHPEYRKYLLNRGLVEDKEQGCILIPHRCQHLKTEVGEPIAFSDGTPYLYKRLCSCAIHNSLDRPEVCRKFHGQKMVKGARFYVPPGCSYKEG